MVSFEGLHFGTNGPFTNRLTPPDVQIAVGPNHVVEMVNVLGRISTKQGVAVRTFSLDTFFGVPSTDFISDPKVHFDTASGRWFASITDVTTGGVLLEVSATEDPVGSWNAYTVSTTTGCADQPLLGLGDFVVVVSANDFASCTSSNPLYLGVQYWVLNKTDLLNGSTARTMSFGPDPTLFSVQPVQSLRSTKTQFMVSTGSGPTSTLTLFSVTGVPPGLVLISQQNFRIRSAAVPPGAPQLGSKSNLDTADNRVQDAMWVDNRLWLSLDVGCTPAGDNRVRSCIRLIEVDTANATVAQDFDVGIAGKYLFYPALRTDEEGHLILVLATRPRANTPGLWWPHGRRRTLRTQLARRKSSGWARAQRRADVRTTPCAVTEITPAQLRILWSRASFGSPQSTARPRDGRRSSRRWPRPCNSLSPTPSRVGPDTSRPR